MQPDISVQLHETSKLWLNGGKDSQNIETCHVCLWQWEKVSCHVWTNTKCVWPSSPQKTCSKWCNPTLMTQNSGCMQYSQICSLDYIDERLMEAFTSFFWRYSNPALKGNVEKLRWAAIRSQNNWVTEDRWLPSVTLILWLNKEQYKSCTVSWKIGNYKTLTYSTLIIINMMTTCLILRWSPFIDIVCPKSR